jgi:hypothetical protein
MDNLKSVLLNNSEINYILNSKILSKSFEYKIKSQLKRKVSVFLECEFPLLLESGIIDAYNLIIYLNNISNALSELVKGKFNYILDLFKILIVVLP